MSPLSRAGSSGAGWFSGSPATHAYPRAVVFPLDGLLSVVHQGNAGGVVKTDELARAQAIPAQFLVDILSDLRADRLEQFGFSGWIGREPHGADPSDAGVVKDGLYGDQVVDLFGQLEQERATFHFGIFPTVNQALIDHPDLTRTDLDSVRLINIQGPTRLREAARARVGGEAGLSVPRSSL
mgnify:CR=1 FL=1